MNELRSQERSCGFMLKGSYALTQQQIYWTETEVNTLLDSIFKRIIFICCKREREDPLGGILSLCIYFLSDLLSL